MAAVNKQAGNPYENLANAVIVQAAEDYRKALRKIKKAPENREAMDEALQIERFFRSAWYQVLTSVDGEFLIWSIREEIK